MSAYTAAFLGASNRTRTKNILLDKCYILRETRHEFSADVSLRAGGVVGLKRSPLLAIIHHPSPNQDNLHFGFSTLVLFSTHCATRWRNRTLTVSSNVNQRINKYFRDSYVALSSRFRVPTCLKFNRSVIAMQAASHYSSYLQSF